MDDSAHRDEPAPAATETRPADARADASLREFVADAIPTIAPHSPRQPSQIPPWPEESVTADPAGEVPIAPDVQAETHGALEPEVSVTPFSSEPSPPPDEIAGHDGRQERRAANAASEVLAHPVAQEPPAPEADAVGDAGSPETLTTEPEREAAPEPAAEGPPSTAGRSCPGTKRQSPIALVTTAPSSSRLHRALDRMPTRRAMPHILLRPTWTLCRRRHASSQSAPFNLMNPKPTYPYPRSLFGTTRLTRCGLRSILEFKRRNTASIRRRQRRSPRPFARSKSGPDRRPASRVCGGQRRSLPIRSRGHPPKLMRAPNRSHRPSSTHRTPRSSRPLRHHPPCSIAPGSSLAINVAPGSRQGWRTRPLSAPRCPHRRRRGAHGDSDGSPACGPVSLGRSADARRSCSASV